jgi:peptidoglycan hydrolase-like protein with peptidoglycan-binding domain
MPAVLRRRTIPAVLALVASVGLPFAVVAPAAASSLPAAVQHRDVIHPGDTGPAVSWLQRDLGVKTGGSFGTYGPLTLKAVEHFQTFHHLAADGIVGPATWNFLLGKQTATKATAKPKAVKPATTSSPNRASRGASRAGWICPVGPSHDITDSFGDPRPGGRHHEGDDIMAPRSSPIYAVESGTVEKAASGSLAGLEIILRGVSGNSFFYAHQSANLVHSGEHVTAGQLIGRVGNTGDAAGGPTHLHFEFWPGGGSAVNPYPKLKAACD